MASLMRVCLQNGPKWSAALIGLCALLLLPNAALMAGATGNSDAVGAVAAMARAAHFPGALVATVPTTSAEDTALSNALIAYGRRTQPDDVSALTGFLTRHPRSGWSSSLLTYIGETDLHYGYFSRAIEAWKAAWEHGKDATEPRARSLIDQAVGNLARLYASLGQLDSLQALLAEIAGRTVTGPATEAIDVAMTELRVAHTTARHLFNCGPLALGELIRKTVGGHRDLSFLTWYDAGPNGTNLALLGELSEKASFPYRLVFREPGQPVPMPAVVHWKVKHFATIVGQNDGRFRVEDTAFPGGTVWVTQAALDTEASGYFLVPADVASAGKWRVVNGVEATRVWGKGNTTGTPVGTAGAQDPKANRLKPLCPLCAADIGESTVSLTLSDTPVGYTPPIGPSLRTTITYNQREDAPNAPGQSNAYYNVSQKWSLNWLTYVTDDPSAPGTSVMRYLAGGGAYIYILETGSTSAFAPQANDGSLLVLASQSPITYTRTLQDGTVEVYAQSDGNTSWPRNIFLSKIIDPQGNTATLNYDGQDRLTSITDAAMRQTFFTYGLSNNTSLVTTITDPFGRSAVLNYDSNGHLVSITDVIGLTSSFTYDGNGYVNSMTTPYGTTNFAYPAPNASCPPSLTICRYLQITDPLGYNEREEWLEPAPVSQNDPVGAPANMPVPPPSPEPPPSGGQNLQYRDSFHWDKNAYAVAGCKPQPILTCIYADARETHFTHDSHIPISLNKGTTIESIKYPLENRIWFNYPGQGGCGQDPFCSLVGGTYSQPIAVGRVLDDGSTQLSHFDYASPNFNLSAVQDPVLRTTSFFYQGTSAIDLSNVWIAAPPSTVTIALFGAYTNHRPASFTDASGQTTNYTYNSAGQLTSATNPLDQTTSYQYNSTGDLTTIINPTPTGPATAATFTYDAFDRIATFTDSEGWTVSYSYDNADRVTKVTYPDGTTDVYTYDRLDLASFHDRQGRVWTYTHDANRRLTEITDPAGNQTQFEYNGTDELTSLIDPERKVTNWTYDVEGRLTAKQYGDHSTNTYNYENTTSRLLSVTDALGQTKQFIYNADNSIANINYLNAANPTPKVAFTYDPNFPRLTSTQDGTGTTQYSYVPSGTLGALRLQQESNPTANSAICYTYDALGRMTSRTIAPCAGPPPPQADVETFQYDSIGRLTSHASDLGSFTLTYVGQTGQILSRQLSGGTIATNWGYLTNLGDRRLASIKNVGFPSNPYQYQQFEYTTTPENFITGITETSDGTTVYPAPSRQTASYNGLNQLVNLSGQQLSFDANGNLLSDGQRNYTWDGENRLSTISYPGQTGKATAFTYDGFGRRTTITSTPAGGGSPATTSYIWCGSRICQARPASGGVAREYFAEGEVATGTPPTNYYYGLDQIGSVRRVFVSLSEAPAYGYDPYGNALQTTAPVTDFGYAGMFYNVDSGLYLTKYRAYDPNSGRWLSRDPVGEAGDPYANLYAYVGGDPVDNADPSGLTPGNEEPCPPIAAAARASTTVAAEAAPTLSAAGNGGDLLAQYGPNVPTVSNGYFNVVTHATEDSAYVLNNGNWTSINTNNLAQMIERSPGYTGQPVCLVACSAGASDTGLAQNLANRLGTNVLGATDTVNVWQSGNFAVAPGGSWRLFTPGN